MYLHVYLCLNLLWSGLFRDIKEHIDTSAVLVRVYTVLNTDQLSSWDFIALVKYLSRLFSLSLFVYLSLAARGPKSDCVTV